MYIHLAKHAYRLAWVFMGGAATVCVALVTGCQSPVGLPPETAAGSDSQGGNVPITPTKLLARGKPEGVSATVNGPRSAVIS